MLFDRHQSKTTCLRKCWHRVQAVQPFEVSGAFPSTNDDREQHNHVAENDKNDIQNFSTCVMLSKPILALKFNQMKMQVEAPIVLSQLSNSLENTASSVP